MATRTESPERLYMQFLALTGCADVQPLLAPLAVRKLDCVLYKYANDPLGIGLLTLADDPAVFTNQLRDMLSARPYQALTVRPEYSMLGRAFCRDAGDTDESTMHAARTTVMNPHRRWAVWYLLRRARQFAGLPQEEQNRLLDEVEAATKIEAGDAGQVRLKCHGLDAHDNDLFVGLVGSDLDELSTMVERYRETEYVNSCLDSLGPFFVGQAIWQGDVGALHAARW